MERVQHSSFASGPDAEDVPRSWITVRRARAEIGDVDLEITAEELLREVMLLMTSDLAAAV
jgi:hypothetical protein